MTDNLLETVTKRVCSDPASGQSLLLFALISTLNVERTGHMYMLAKLKELTPENRQLAYGLMEMMANNQIHNDSWNQFMAGIQAAMQA